LAIEKLLPKLELIELWRALSILSSCALHCMSAYQAYYRGEEEATDHLSAKTLSRLA